MTLGTKTCTTGINSFNPSFNNNNSIMNYSRIFGTNFPSVQSGTSLGGGDKGRSAKSLNGGFAENHGNGTPHYEPLEIREFDMNNPDEDPLNDF